MTSIDAIIPLITLCRFLTIGTALGYELPSFSQPIRVDMDDLRS
jgi:hypothetical protein